MHFDIAHSAGKRRAQRAAVRRQIALERPLRARLIDVLNTDVAAVAAHLRHGVVDVDAVVNARRHALARALSLGYTAAGAEFLASVETAFAERGQGSRKGGVVVETKGMADEFWRAFHWWSNRQMAVRVQQVSDVTKRWIRRLIKTRVDEGASYQEIADGLLDRAKGINQGRAMRIARTEVHAASSYATDAAVRSTRVKFEREWVSMRDDRTRPAFGDAATKKAPWDHRKAHGQRRAMDQPFDVSGEKLMYPGDPSGSAGNIINCR